MIRVRTDLLPSHIQESFNHTLVHIKKEQEENAKKAATSKRRINADKERFPLCELKYPVKVKKELEHYKPPREKIHSTGKENSAGRWKTRSSGKENSAGRSKTHLSNKENSTGRPKARSSNKKKSTGQSKTHSSNIEISTTRFKNQGTMKLGWETITYGLRARNHDLSSQTRSCLSVYVKGICSYTTPANIYDHFMCCGPITEIKLSPPVAIIEFRSVMNVELALKLHQSMLKDAPISVETHMHDVHTNRNVLRTIFLRNSQNLKTIDAKKLKLIFERCGSVTAFTANCSKDILARVTYRNSTSIDWAMKVLHYTKVDGIFLDLCQYDEISDIAKTKIFVRNIHPGTTGKELSDHFEWAGSIAYLSIDYDCALIRFSSWESYTRSFLLNESVLNGKLLFVEPYSDLKCVEMKKKIVYSPNEYEPKRKMPRLR